MGAQPSKTNDQLTRRLKSDHSLTPRSFPRTTGETITLPTQPPRRVGYALYGHHPSTSRHIILFFHGTPGTRFFFTHQHALYAKSHAISVVVPERPGFGLSDTVHRRTLLDGADDARQLIDHLRCTHVYVIGYSAGGPYALAFARKYAQRCLGVAIVSGLSPYVPGIMAGMTLFSRMGYMMARYAPRMLVCVLRAMVDEARREVTEGKLSEFSHSENEWFQRNEDVRRMFVECIMELYAREGGVRAEAQDYAIAAADWGFRLEEVEGRVFLYGGGSDNKCTLGMFRELERGLREGKAELVLANLVEEEDHLMFYRVFESVVSDLTTYL